MKLAREETEDRLDAALKIAREAFKGTKLTMKDIDNAVKSVRRKACEKKEQGCHLGAQDDKGRYKKSFTKK